MRKIYLIMLMLTLSGLTTIASAESTTPSVATFDANSNSAIELHHNQASALVAAGKILTLRETLSVIKHSCKHSKLMDAKLFQNSNSWSYQLKLKGKGGELLQLEVDAATGHLLSSSLPCQAGR